MIDRSAPPAPSGPRIMAGHGSKAAARGLPGPSGKGHRAWHSGGVGAVEVDEAIEDREPSAWYLDGANFPRFYRTGRAVLGRPYVMVHKGERTRASIGPFSRVGPDVVLMVG